MHFCWHLIWFDTTTQSDTPAVATFLPRLYLWSAGFPLFKVKLHPLPLILRQSSNSIIISVLQITLCKKLDRKQPGLQTADQSSAPSTLCPLVRRPRAVPKPVRTFRSNMYRPSLGETRHVLIPRNASLLTLCFELKLAQ